MLTIALIAAGAVVSYLALRRVTGPAGNAEEARAAELGGQVATQPASATQPAIPVEEPAPAR